MRVVLKAAKFHSALHSARILPLQSQGTTWMFRIAPVKKHSSHHLTKMRLNSHSCVKVIPTIRHPVMKSQVSRWYREAANLTRSWSAILRLWTRQIQMTRSRGPSCATIRTKWLGAKHKDVCWRSGSLRPLARLLSPRTPLSPTTATLSSHSRAAWSISSRRSGTMKTGPEKWTRSARPMYIKSMRWWGRHEASKWLPKPTSNTASTSTSRTCATLMSPSSPHSRRTTELCFSAHPQDASNRATKVYARTSGSQCLKRSKLKSSMVSKSCTSQDTATSTKTHHPIDSTLKSLRTVLKACSSPR